jgi:integrase
MASIRKKQNSRYYIACFTDSSGVQRQLSTKLTNRVKAQQIAQKYELAYAIKLTEAQARKVISGVYEELHGEDLHHSTVREFFNEWLKNKAVETTSGTQKRYKNAAEKLIEFLAGRADRDIAYIHKRDITALRDKTAEDLTTSTANTDLKILRVAFRQAVAEGLRLDNPAASVNLLKSRRDPTRRPFTEDELKKILAVASAEWRGLILAGIYTGQRLGDLAGMRWKTIDPDERIISFDTRKTNRTIRIPIPDPLWRYLASLPTQNSNDPVFPEAQRMQAMANGESRGLSGEFHRILVKAGLANTRSKENTGRGHSTRRATSELSFHALRHTTNSWLKKAGVPESVVKDILGHESNMVSLKYTHVDDESKRMAVKKLPDLG